MRLSILSVIVFLFVTACDEQIAGGGYDAGVDGTVDSTVDTIPDGARDGSPVCNGEPFYPEVIITEGFDCYGHETDMSSVACKQYCCGKDEVLTLVGMVDAEGGEPHYFGDTDNCGGCGVKCGGDAPYCRCNWNDGVKCMCTGVEPDSK